MFKSPIAWISGLVLAWNLMQPAQALPGGKIGLELGGGANLILPYLAARVSWQPDASPWAFHAAFSNGLSLNNQFTLSTLTAGAQYYFTTQGVFQSYVKGDLGVGSGQPLLLAGVGTDVMFTDNLGLNLGIDTGFGGGVAGIGLAGVGLALRPEINLKLKF